MAARGGSDIAAWTSEEAQRKEPALKPLLASWAEKDAAYTPAIEAAENAAYEKAIDAWNTKFVKRSRRDKSDRRSLVYPLILETIGTILRSCTTE